ncbi:tetratricopeptide repeat protein [Ursidibacter arcticus]
MKKFLFFLSFLAPFALAENLAFLTIPQLTEKAEQGNPMAQTILGTAYHFGQTKDYLEKDYSKALHWYKKAAQQNEPIALYQLGVMHEFGRGVEKDGKEAFKWYLKSAELGERDAQSRVAFAYYKGEWVAKDDKQAFYWFKKVTEQGLYYDMLGIFYFHGIGTERNDEKAFENFIKAYQQQPQKASLQEQLGIMYEFGLGTNEDVHRAFDFYRQAAEQGKAYSQYRLAYFYEMGKVVSPNKEMALAYYQLACKNGEQKACETMGK